MQKDRKDRRQAEKEISVIYKGLKEKGYILDDADQHLIRTSSSYTSVNFQVDGVKFPVSSGDLYQFSREMEENRFGFASKSYFDAADVATLVNGGGEIWAKSLHPSRIPDEEHYINLNTLILISNSIKGETLKSLQTEIEDGMSFEQEVLVKMVSIMGLTSRIIKGGNLIHEDKIRAVCASYLAKK